jgi:predicted DNA-binding transcriptional regulator AlpA
MYETANRLTLADGPHEYLTRTEAAALARRSPKTWDRFRRLGKSPAPIRIGGRPLWRRAEVLAWLDAGAPDRATWGRMKATLAAGPAAGVA